MKPPTSQRTCAWCTGLIWRIGDKTPLGDMHPDCAKAYRRQNPTADRPTTLPKHLR